jgi:predicted SnoaL-like aldol condensation-catalyzing enzyme
MINRRTFSRLAPLGAVSVLAACATPPAPSADSNRATALAFGDMVFNQKRVQEAFDAYVGPTYTQHNPLVPDGREGAITGLGFMLSQNPQFRYIVRRSIAEGDMVALHVEAYYNPQHRGKAVVDIFRFEDGKIVEHWDVLQEVPETARNTNTMF